MQSNYVTGTIPAAVLNDPIYPLIPGCKYVCLAEPHAPVLAATVQTRAQAKADLEPPFSM